MTTTPQPIALTGCRHDVLGHALKAIGVLRAISTCAAPEDCDPDAEGWWNPENASFMIRSVRYSDTQNLVTFFAEEYRPTPIISAWNKSSGLSDGTLSSVRENYNCDEFHDCLTLAEASADDLLEDSKQHIAPYRDNLPSGVSESLDAITLSHLRNRNDNPLFVNRGQQGRTDVFRLYWSHFKDYQKTKKMRAVFARMCLFGERSTQSGLRKGKGAPFFPEIVKSYNQGASWVVENMPFCPLDYVLAVEGALTMRGAISKALSVQGRSFAAFPFVFEGSETMTDDKGEIKGLGASLWLPLWTQPTTWYELNSFILDSQARLPSKDCRFSSDFARAIRSQGVDAGIAAFQEFRFKMKGARVPWAVPGRFVSCSETAFANLLNELLAPIDAVGYLNQFRFRTPNEVKHDRKPDLHPLRAPVLDAIDAAAAEPEASKILDVLAALATLNAHLARSKSLRKDIDDKERVIFIPPLLCDDWSAALQDLESEPEFEIARALASIRGHEKQHDGTYSEVEPFQGSLVPLRRGHNSWYLPDSPSAQAVWTGIDLSHDLAAIFARRVINSAKDVRPGVVGTCTARLVTILQFLRGELNDQRIARLIEALSLIDWRFSAERTHTNGGEATDEEDLNPVPVAYAAARSLLEVACDMRRAQDEDTGDQAGPRAKVQRTVALLSRQEPRLAAAATVDALRRLAIVGVPNPYGEGSQREKPRLAGRDVVQVGESLVIDIDSAHRLAAAVLIPLDWRDRWTLFRAITLPQTTS